MAKVKEVVLVPAIEDMDDDTFLKHLELRHAAECKIEGKMHRHSMYAWVTLYRTFHARLHTLAVPGQYDHEHDDPEEES